MKPVRIEENRLEDVVHVLVQIPEFENVPSENQILERLNNKPHLVLTAHFGDEVVGFKLGYERDGNFYSWLGGILPAYRKQHVASDLASYQEGWAKSKGYQTVWMKTRNCFPQMLIMALGRGFRIVGFEPREEIGQHRIVLAKSL